MVTRTVLAGLVVALALVGPDAYASAAHKAVERDYVMAPAAPARQTVAEADAKSVGCVSCHTQSDTKTMHTNPAVRLGCTDCHGGNAEVALPAGVARGESRYTAAKEAAHVLPRYPDDWHYP
ncbi:MAG: hypothetical protein ACKOZX_16690, partial [Gammaproteobacteria bacterium]